MRGWKSLPHGIVALGKSITGFVCEAANRLFNHEAKLILARAEAERIKAEAEAIRADAARTTAEAQEILATTKRRDELLKMLKKGGSIEGLSDHQGDMLNLTAPKKSVRTKTSNRKRIK